MPGDAPGESLALRPARGSLPRWMSLAHRTLEVHMSRITRVLACGFLAVALALTSSCERIAPASRGAILREAYMFTKVSNALLSTPGMAGVAAADTARPHSPP